MRPGRARLLPGRPGGEPTTIRRISSSPGRGASVGPSPIRDEVAEVAAMLAKAARPLIIAGGGVLYSEAEDVLAAFAERHNIPFAETQAGKGALAATHPLDFGLAGRDRLRLRQRALPARPIRDRASAPGSRISPPASGRCSKRGAASSYPAQLHALRRRQARAVPLVGDARRALDRLSKALGDCASTRMIPARRRPGWPRWNAR